MNGLLWALGALLFFAGLLASIALHEIGHMWPAKKFGMKVTQYFVGFGRTVWSVKRGETEYGVKAVPLGGYVRIIGMFPPAKQSTDAAGRVTVRQANTGPFQSLIENARSAEYQTIDPADTPRLFYAKPWWQKLIVMTGGPLMNVLIAAVLFSGVFMLYGVPVSQTTVKVVTDCVIPASEARKDRVCQPGDQESPAKKAGFQPGDKVVEFNGTAITSWDELTPLIRANTDKPASIVVERSGQRVTLHTSTIINQVYDAPGSDKIVSVGYLGVSPETEVVRQGFGYTVERMGELTAMTAKALVSFPGKLVGVAKAIAGGERAQDSPMSIVGASRVAGEVVARGDVKAADKLAFFVGMLASVNLFIALFNFVPLLPLDGGHIAGALWEALKRAIARLRGRPDPGHVDVAKLLPLAYLAASFIVVMGAMLVIADVVNPIRLFNG
ncbi:MAG TPA: M50 family metallopeptidase [Kribbellaceae bacterium]|jgi:membrane-associated protease RseP (regulator of RpoE activity)